MNLPQCQALLATTLADARCSNPEKSPYGRTGQSVLRMASAYESDGKTFMAGGDPVDALAAFLYSFGWLHCGIASGLLVTAGGRTECPFGGGFEPVPAAQYAKLDEKTGRYSRLLETAIASVDPAPDPGTPSHAFAVQVRFIAGVYTCSRGTGRHLPENGRMHSLVSATGTGGLMRQSGPGSFPSSHTGKSSRWTKRETPFPAR